MTISEMHYDFKKKLNKVDSEQNRNLLVPEIDWALNEAQELFIKMIVEPRQRSFIGFEKSQRTVWRRARLHAHQRIADVFADRRVTVDVGRKPRPRTDAKTVSFGSLPCDGFALAASSPLLSSLASALRGASRTR